MIEEYSLDDEKLLRLIATGHIGLSAMAFMQDSNLLITTSVDKTIEMRNSELGPLVAKRDGRMFASAGGGMINL